MRKLFFLMAFAAIFATACDKGDVFYEEYYDTMSSSYRLEAPAEDWVLRETDNEVFFEIALSMPPITQAVCRNGEVNAYLIENGVQFAMPDSRPFDDSEFPYTRVISYAFEPGVIYFTIAYSDFLYDYDHPFQPIDFTFRVVVTEPY